MQNLDVDDPAPKLSAHWKDAWIINRAQKGSLVVVPAPERYVAAKELSIRRFLVFTTSGNNVSDDRIVEFVGENYDVTSNIDLLLEGYNSSYISGFTGAIYPLPTSPTPPLPIRSGDMEVDTLIDKRIIQEILKEKFKKDNGWVIINYVFRQDGNVLDVSSYILPKNTLITPKELAVIDKRLRKEVKASFKGREYLEHPVIFYGREIRF